MFEHMSDLARSHAGKREGRELVLTEELRARGFVAVAWRATPELSDKKQLIGVEGMDGVALHVAVEQGRELGDLDFVAGFFADFASGGDRRRLAHISPPPGSVQWPSASSRTRRTRLSRKAATRTSIFGVA